MKKASNNRQIPALITSFYGRLAYSNRKIINRNQSEKEKTFAGTSNYSKNT